MTEGRIALPSTELMPLDGECGTPAVAASGRRQVIRLHGEAGADLTSTSMATRLPSHGSASFRAANHPFQVSEFRCIHQTHGCAIRATASAVPPSTDDQIQASTTFPSSERIRSREYLGAATVRSSGGGLPATRIVRELRVQPDIGVRRAVGRRSE
jgi:hypothetical protein